jgi:hypothetical protein
MSSTCARCGRRKGGDVRDVPLAIVLFQLFETSEAREIVKRRDGGRDA